MALVVMKFGGSSLERSERVRRAANRLAAQWRAGDQVIGVLSAQGRSTDQLIAVAREINPDPSPRELDQLLAIGEQQSVALCAMAVQALGCPVVSLTGWQAGLTTDGVHGNASVTGLSGQRLQQELARGRIVLVAGFQGICPAGDVTTLGRGGSDTTAVALACLLDADVCKIYTDVDGVYDKDPRTHPDAVKYDRLDYETMLRLVRNGAQVLHDKAVLLAQEYGLTVEVCSSLTDAPGTLIQDEA